MEIKRLYEGASYKGKEITYSNGNKEWRNTQNKKVMAYNSATDTYRDKNNCKIKRD